MTITKAQAQLSLQGTATPTRTNVSNAASIGSALSTKNFSDADIVFSFLVTATGATDVATLTYSTGDVAQTSGTPTITDAGVDFEGEDLGTIDTLYAVMVEQTVDGAMEIDGDFTEANYMTKTGDKALWIWDDGVTGSGSSLASENLVLDLNASGVAAKVTIIAKT
jgi:hypothetical protein